MHAKILAMILSLMPHVDADRYARAIVVALASEPREDVPDASLVVAIMYTESRGLPKVCGEDRFHGSNRGLMQVRVPHSRCPDGRHRASDLFDVETSIHTGVHILANLARYERTVHHGRHDFVSHYGGFTQSNNPYVLRVRRIQGQLDHGSIWQKRSAESSGHRARYPHLRSQHWKISGNDSFVL